VPDCVGIVRREHVARFDQRPAFPFGGFDERAIRGRFLFLARDQLDLLSNQLTDDAACNFLVDGA
jgi:hypothetical protein